MASGSPVDRSSDDQVKSPADTVRSLVSLFLVLHLLCLVIAFASSVAPSPLQLRLLGVLRPYVRVLNFELPYSQYNLTQASELDVDHRLEILPQGRDENDPDSWIRLPDRGFRGGERYKRYQRLAQQMGRFNQLSMMMPDMGAVVGKLAQAVAAHFLYQRETKPQQVRCRRHFLQSIDAITRGSKEERDPYSRTFFRVAYAANVVVDEAGNVSVVKIEMASEVARPDTGGN